MSQSTIADARGLLGADGIPDLDVHRTAPLRRDYRRKGPHPDRSCALSGNATSASKQFRAASGRRERSACRAASRNATCGIFERQRLGRSRPCATSPPCPDFSVSPAMSLQSRGRPQARDARSATARLILVSAWPALISLVEPVDDLLRGVLGPAPRQTEVLTTMRPGTQPPSTVGTSGSAPEPLPSSPPERATCRPRCTRSTAGHSRTSPSGSVRRADRPWPPRRRDRAPERCRCQSSFEHLAGDMVGRVPMPPMP